MKTWLSIIAISSLVFTGLVHAAPQSKPNGPWLTDEQNVSLAALRSYAQLWHTLEQLDRSAKEEFVLSSAPRLSNTGREIPVVTIGSGPQRIMIIAQQHGNEYVVSEAMVDLARDLSDNSRESRAIRDALTLTIVPRVNVDGFDASVEDAFGNTPPWRQNYDPSCVSGPCPAFYQRGRGYDINRYHSFLEDGPEVDPYVGGPNPVPESVAMRLLFDEFQPSVVIDFHHQGSYVDADGNLITGSTLWPNATSSAEALGVVDQFEAGVELAKKWSRLWPQSSTSTVMPISRSIPVPQHLESPVTPMDCWVPDRCCSRCVGVLEPRATGTLPRLRTMQPKPSSRPWPMAHCSTRTLRSLKTFPQGAGNWRA